MIQRLGKSPFWWSNNGSRGLFSGVPCIAVLLTLSERRRNDNEVDRTHIMQCELPIFIFCPNHNPIKHNTFHHHHQAKHFLKSTKTRLQAGSAKIFFAACSDTITIAADGLAVIMPGKMDASTTNKLSVPYTLVLRSTTAVPLLRPSSGPILAVPETTRLALSS